MATIARTQDGETCLVSSVFFFFSLSSVIFFSLKANFNAIFACFDYFTGQN